MIGSLKSSLVNLRYENLKKSLYDLSHTFSTELTYREYQDFFKFSFVRNSWSRMYSWYKNVMRDEMHKKSMNISNHCTVREFIAEKLNHEAFNQLSFITDCNGDVPLDFIGRFENLQEDLDYVCRQLSIEDSSLPDLLMSNNDHYSIFFFDNETKDLVYKHYKAEIEYFCFSFGD